MNKIIILMLSLFLLVSCARFGKYDKKVFTDKEGNKYMLLLNGFEVYKVVEIKE